MIPKEEFTDVTLVIEILTHLAYLTYLSLVIIAKEVKIVKEVISCANVSVPKHCFHAWDRSRYTTI